EWPKGSDCKSDGSAFGGSNPPPSTIITKACTVQAFLFSTGSGREPWFDKIVRNYFERSSVPLGYKYREVFYHPPPSTIITKACTVQAFLFPTESEFHIPNRRVLPTVYPLT
ncbi:hypothetical protein, partial [Thalassotalea litorea]|uniref:hypothetical protein n=1 Tax=Thalassotalea litorea TaxID=2020715 RepID=UPI00373586B7